MKGKTRLLFISAVLILAVCFTGTGSSWGGGADLNPPPAAASPDAQTVVAQADATNTEAPAQTTTPQAAAPATTTTTAPGNVPTTEVTVTAEKEKKPKEGSAEVGYKVENTTTTGPWGQMALQDTPYSIMVMPSELIENLQAPSVDMLYRINPLIQPWTPSGRSTISNIILRGFSQSDVNARAEDGIHAQLYDTSLEDKERVEVLTGLSGFLYGPENVGGMVNFVNKRPTDTPLYSLTAGNYGGDSYYVHGDFGGPIYKDKVAFRLNVVEQNGDTNVSNQHIERNLLSGAVDWHVMDNLLLQFNAAHIENRMDGTAPFWFFAQNADGSALAFHPSAPLRLKKLGAKMDRRL